MINLIKIALARLGLYPASAALFASPLLSMAEDLRDYEASQHEAAMRLNARAQEASKERNLASGLASKLEEVLK